MKVALFSLFFTCCCCSLFGQTGAAIDNVVSVAPGDAVVSRASNDRVVAIAATDCVVGIGAKDAVVTAGSGDAQLSLPWRLQAKCPGEGGRCYQLQSNGV